MFNRQHDEAVMKTATPNAPSPWLSIRDVATRWRVCGRTVRRHIDSGLLPARKLGSLVRINEQDLRIFENRLPHQNHDLK
ncbi:helix-turn-helix domain-containing protein [Skermanella stibiiresistens]|uniref:helix-turn-helix domain-containing protein n=1 Tax=Skermanella stibiiresistens TaxID=913326 RepID=UPI000A07A8E2